MAETHLNLLIRPDPDIAETAAGILRLIQDAYARGHISWTRRCEMLDDPFQCCVIRTYEAPSEPGTLLAGFYVEPAPAFLAEIGLTVPV